MAEFRVLGPVELWAGGRSLDLGPAKQRTVLAALLLDAGRHVTMDTLIERVWDDEPPTEARNVLYAYITRIRRVLGQAVDEGERPVSLERGRGGYLLDVRREQVDLYRFRALVDQARSRDVGGEQRAALLRQALALWRGTALAGVPGGWATRVRDGLEQQRLGAATQWAEAELRHGHRGAVIDELHELVSRYPLAEPLVALLMRALYLDGRGAEALDRYARARRRLVDELGVEPGAELRAVHEAILRDDPADLGVTPEPAAPAVPAAPEAPTPVAAAPPPSGRPRPAQLPADLPAFTGRDAELRRLDALLDGAAAPAVVVSAIAGTAGVGKTALAVHWAHRVRDRFADGQLYVNLRGYAPTSPLRPIDALAGFLPALGVPAEQVPADLDQAAGVYRTLLADKRMLVLLDNAQSADQVRPLLPGSPGCLVLVTSRDRLGGLVAREGAARITLDVLPPAEAAVLLARVLGADRVEAEPEAAAELAGSCAHLPLALRIAAANLTDHPGRSIAEHVAALHRTDRLTALAVEGDEQSAVRAAFDLSYAALPDTARRAFRLLGLVPGPDVTPAAAAALTGTAVAEAERALDRLAAAHLLGQPAPGRYAGHDLMRLYAAERVRLEGTEPERREASRRFFDWYLATADAAARQLYPEKLRLPVPSPGPASPAGFEDHSGALAWLDAERTGLIAAIRHAAEHGPHRAAWLLADTLRGYFWLRMPLVDWLAAAQAGLAAAEADGDLRAQAALLLNLADAHQCQSRYRQAIEYYTRAAGLNRESGWLEGQAAALGNLGNLYWRTGRLREAADQHLASLAIDRQIGRLAGQAASLANLAAVCRELGRLTEAADQLGQALALDRKLGSKHSEAMDLANLGGAGHALGRLDEALGHLTGALTLGREVGDRDTEAEVLRLLAEVHRDAGRYEPARELAGAALAQARELGNGRAEAEALHTLGAVHRCLGEHRQAVALHQRGVSLAREADTRYPEVTGLIGLAAAQLGLGDLDQARAYARQAQALAHQAGYRLLEGQAGTVLAAVHAAAGETDAAVREAERALAGHRATGHRLGTARSLLVLGRVLAQSGREAAAAEHWREALALFADIGAPETDEVRRLQDTP